MSIGHISHISLFQVDAVLIHTPVQNDFPKKGLALDPGSLGCHSIVQDPKICVYQVRN